MVTGPSVNAEQFMMKEEVNHSTNQPGNTYSENKIIRSYVIVGRGG